MMIFTGNLILLPIVLMVWAIDGYLFLLLVKVAIGQSSSRTANSDWQRNLTRPFDWINTRLKSRGLGSHPAMAWLVLIGTLCLIRHGLIQLIQTFG